MQERFEGLDDGSLYGIATPLGGNAPIGPFLLSLAYISGEDICRLQLSLGRHLQESTLLNDIY